MLYSIGNDAIHKFRRIWVSQVGASVGNRIAYLFKIIGLSTIVSGCGARVPDLQDNLLATESQRVDFVRLVARNVRCELRDATIRLYESQRHIDPENRNLRWFDNWGAQLAWTLSVNERSGLSPNIGFSPLRYFNIGVEASASTQADRVLVGSGFFPIAELKDRQKCNADDRRRGSFILESDLKLFEVLQAFMVTTGLGDTPARGTLSGPNNSDGFSQTIKFTLTTSGGVTPAWKLVRFEANQGGTFLSASRERVQELRVTFGPLDPSWKETVLDDVGQPRLDPVTRRPLTRSVALAPAAANVALAAEIGSAIASRFTNGLRP